MAHSNTSDNWGTAAVTVQQSSVPSSLWRHLPRKCVLHTAFPIPIRNRRGVNLAGAPLRLSFPPPPILHSQGSAESPVTQLQLWGGTVPSPQDHLNSSLYTPAHSRAFPSTQHHQQHLSCVSPDTASEATWSSQKRTSFSAGVLSPPGSVCCSLFADLFPFIRPAWSLITSWC